jgi:hypothetical protein
MEDGEDDHGGGGRKRSVAQNLALVQKIDHAT